MTEVCDTLPPTSPVQRPRLGDNRASVQAAMVQAQYRRLAVPLLVSCCWVLECWAWRCGVGVCTLHAADRAAWLDLQSAAMQLAAHQCASTSPPQEGPPGEAVAEKKRQKRAQLKQERHRLKYSVDNYDKVGAGLAGRARHLAACSLLGCPRCCHCRLRIRLPSSGLRWASPQRSSAVCGPAP